MRIIDLGMLFLLASLWGASFLFIRVASPALGPLVLVDLRVLIAAGALALYAFIIRRRHSCRTHWKKYIVLGTLNGALPFALISAAEIHLTASFGAILNSTTPLFTAVIAAIWLKHPLNWKKAFGLLFGFAGVAVLVGWSPIPISRVVLLATCESLLGALFYAIGGVYAAKNFEGVSALDLAIGQQLGAGIVLFPFAVINVPAQWPSLAVVVCTLALALLSTAFAYLLFFPLLNRVGPTKTLSVTFLVPVFGMVWAALFLGEPVGIGMFVGLVIILGSVALVTEVKLHKSKTQESASV